MQQLPGYTESFLPFDNKIIMIFRKQKDLLRGLNEVLN